MGSIPDDYEGPNKEEADKKPTVRQKRPKFDTPAQEPVSSPPRPPGTLIDLERVENVLDI